MNSTITLLSGQHQEVLLKLSDVETRLADPNGDWELAALVAFLEADVAAHFAIEEEALFPMLARHSHLREGPLAVMDAEHAEFRTLLSGLGAAVRSGDRAGQRTHAHEIIDLLRAHIAKEDQVLFPMAARVLSPDEQGEVDARAAALKRPALGASA